MNTLIISQLTKHFEGVRALEEVSLEIEKGKITAIVGPNGSGKTTLFNLLTGMVKIDKGYFVVSGSKPLFKIKPAEVLDYGISRTFQNIRLFEQMRVLDNILVVLTKRNIWSSLFEKHQKYYYHQAKEVLERVGLGEKRNQLAKNLSYGQRKLLEIARTLATKSEIYLFDEPFAGLFPKMIEKVSEILLQLKNQEKTIILIDHNMDLIRKIADYVFVLDNGRLLAQGSPNEVLEKKEVIAAYLGE